MTLFLFRGINHLKTIHPLREEGGIILSEECFVRAGQRVLSGNVTSSGCVMAVIPRRFLQRRLLA
ncbi:hypothetical protein ABR33_20590 [Enterobacter bugandensis]|nr:hypothetical protein ABR33_20590 [Enterobacter bugandensis]